MGAFVVAGVIEAFAVLLFFASIAVYMSYDAPSVQGDGSAPYVFLISGTVIAIIVASSHWWSFYW